MKILVKYGRFVIVKNKEEYQVYPLNTLTLNMIPYFEKEHDRFRICCFVCGYKNIAEFRAEQYKGYFKQRAVTVASLSADYQFESCI